MSTQTMLRVLAAIDPARETVLLEVADELDGRNAGIAALKEKVRLLEGELEWNRLCNPVDLRDILRRVANALRCPDGHELVDWARLAADANQGPHTTLSDLDAFCKARLSKEDIQ